MGAGLNGGGCKLSGMIVGFFCLLFIRKMPKDQDLIGVQRGYVHAEWRGEDECGR